MAGGGVAGGCSSKLPKVMDDDEAGSEAFFAPHTTLGAAVATFSREDLLFALLFRAGEGGALLSAGAGATGAAAGGVAVVVGMFSREFFGLRPLALPARGGSTGRSCCDDLGLRAGVPFAGEGEEVEGGGLAAAEGACEATNAGLFHAAGDVGVGGGAGEAGTEVATGLGTEDDAT